PFEYKRRTSFAVGNIGDTQVPVVIADFSRHNTSIKTSDLESIGYTYHEDLDKWTIADGAADYIYIGKKQLYFELPGTLQVICDFKTWQEIEDKIAYHPLIDARQASEISDDIKKLFLQIDIDKEIQNLAALLSFIEGRKNIILCINSTAQDPLHSIRNFMLLLHDKKIETPVIICTQSTATSIDKQLIALSTYAGGLLIDGYGDGIWLSNENITQE